MVPYAEMYEEADMRLCLLFGGNLRKILYACQYGDLDKSAVLCRYDCNDERQFVCVDEDERLLGVIDDFIMTTGHCVYCVLQDPVLEEAYAILYIDGDEEEWPDEIEEMRQVGGAVVYATGERCGDMGFAWAPFDCVGTIGFDLDWKNLRIGEGA